MKRLKEMADLINAYYEERKNRLNQFLTDFSFLSNGDAPAINTVAEVQRQLPPTPPVPAEMPQIHRVASPENTQKEDAEAIVDQVLLAVQAELEPFELETLRRKLSLQGVTLSVPQVFSALTNLLEYGEVCVCNYADRTFYQSTLRGDLSTEDLEVYLAEQNIEDLDDGVVEFQPRRTPSRTSRKRR